MGDVGGDDGESSEIETGVELFVILKNEGGENDSVDGFEIHRKAGSVGAEPSEEIDVECVGEDRAEKSESEERKPVGGNRNFKVDAGCKS